LLPADTLGDELTGGYMIKIDWASGNDLGSWISNYSPIGGTNGQTIRFLYDYPRQPVPAQVAYIQAYVDSFETALAGPDFADPQIGFRHYLGTGTTIDHFLLNELARNVDGYRQSTYLYKDKLSNGGKLKMGPEWDFDLAWHNNNYCNGSNVEGWDYRFSDYCPSDQNLPPFWWERLMEDNTFANDVQCRWTELRTDVLSTERLDAWCDSMALRMNVGANNNFAQWSVLGAWVWPNPLPIPPDYAGEIQELKTWIHERTAWMDANLPGLCISTGTTAASTAPTLSVFPNPFHDRINVHLPETEVLLNALLVDATGRTTELSVRKDNMTGSIALDTPPSLANGSYALRLFTKERALTTLLVKAKD
jgi:hypothetical protein